VYSSVFGAMAADVLHKSLGVPYARSMHLGYFSSAVLFAALMVVPAVVWWRFNLNAVIAFWWAYVLTRPLGASLAEWFGKSRKLTGLGVGDGRVAVIATAAIVVLVGYLAVARRDIQPGQSDVLRAVRGADSRTHGDAVESSDGLAANERTASPPGRSPWSKGHTTAKRRSGNRQPRVNSTFLRFRQADAVPRLEQNHQMSRTITVWSQGFTPRSNPVITRANIKGLTSFGAANGGT